MRRDLRTSNKAALGRYLTQIDWPLLSSPLESCEEKWQVFQDVIHSGLDTIMPVKPVKICTADVPWMNESLKSLIMKRQKAFSAYGPDSAHFKCFRNLVNRERKICRGKYYESKIQHLKDGGMKQNACSALRPPTAIWLASLTSKNYQNCLSKSKRMPSISLPSNRSGNINYQLLLSKFLSSPTRPKS